jgi:hypothetical protein
MFIKTIVKTDIKTGVRYNYYRLCQSYRIGNKTRHRSIITLGKLDELGDKQSYKILADRIEQLLIGSLDFGTSPLDPKIEHLAQKYYKTIIERKLIDVSEKKAVPQSKEPKDVSPQSSFDVVDINTLEHEQVREIGAEWLCYQGIEQLGLPGFLSGQNWDQKKIRRGLLGLVSRCIFPESEHKTESWISKNSAVAELFDFEPDTVTRHHLYFMAHQWYKIKEATEIHLSKITNELFDLEDKIILYDLTNTYFEGRKTNSEIARFGQSKEKRKDAKLAALALVVNAEGFVKYSQLYPGNIADCKTLEQTVEDLAMRVSISTPKPTVIMDAGIATDDNLTMLRKKGYQYLCVSRSSIKDYQEIIKDRPITHLMDKRESPIEIVQFKDTENQDNVLFVRSEKKAKKEVSMKQYFTKHFEEGLEQIKKGIHSKSGTKKITKVYERLGRLKQKYPSGVRFYDVEILPDTNNNLATDIIWTNKEPKIKEDEGIYFLRTNIEKIDDPEFWRIYNIIREIESVFRVLKTDLNFRPVFHQYDESSKAHLNLAILAYQVVNTIRYQLKLKNINHDWSNIVRIMNTQKAVTSTILNNQGQKIIIRKCSNPIKDVKEIYDALNYKYQPYIKKSVLPEK